ncbi:Adenylate kinase [Blastococcus aurantiacus]|uniref:Adenylate kinase n=1 Tax=Blastococcus aurantiacus TaxID=1550231 RepID=A0A1G7P387_9ACTN|nr:AAA family ATPase [Blastococcus aurantiacus]SDF80733.1 Adenylate kinase [Blastococcus aurantiacus]
MNGPAVDLPPGVARILVVGSSGAGKTTMARALAERLGVPHTELDSLWHGPGWVPRPEFEQDVEAMLTTGRWVTEYQYRPVKDRLLTRAEAVVWLDHPFWLVAGRLLRRSLVRAVTRRAYWNGNRESFAMWLRPSHPLRIVFSPEFSAKRRRTEAELAAAAARGVVVVRLRGSRQADRWLAAQG